MLSKPVFSFIAFVLALCCTASCSADKGAKETPPPPERSRLDRLDNDLAVMLRFMEERSDSLPYEYADTFEMKMVEALCDPETFGYPFDSLQASGVGITTSDDGRIRVFNWMHPWSGSWRHYPAIIQARVAPGKYTVQNARVFYDEEAFPYIWVHHIYRLNDSLYLVQGGGQFMGKMPFEITLGYALSDTGVSDDAPLFYDSDRDTLVSAWYLDKLWYIHNADKFGHNVPVMMNYREDVGELSFPELIDGTGEPIGNDVMADDSVHPSGKTVRFRFNGKSFEPITQRR